MNSNEENWDFFFQKLDILKKEFWIKQENFSLDGITGWTWDIQVAFFNTSIRDYTTDYVEYMLLLFWYHNLTEGDICYFKNYNFKEMLLEQFHQMEGRLPVKVDVMEFVHNMRKRMKCSYERFQGSNATSTWSVCENNYFEFDNYLNYFQVPAEYSVWSIGTFEEDEMVAYFIFGDMEFQIVVMEDCI